MGSHLSPITFFLYAYYVLRASTSKILEMHSLFKQLSFFFF